MLVDIYIKNYILIEKIHINFSEKLNIFTGETGAGKSMIFSALNVGLGEKANGDCVRRNSEKAVIQLIFSVSSKAVIDILEKNDIELEDGILIITREMYASGRTVIKINDSRYTLSVLREITSKLMDIHGQHSHQSLLYPKNHIDLLDLSGDSKHEELIEKVKESSKNITKLKNEIDSILSSGSAQIDVNYIKFQINEIEALNITEDDEKNLEDKYNYLKNIENINSSSNNSLKIISGNYESPGIKEMTENAVSNLSEIIEYDEELKRIFSSLESISYQLDDISSDLRKYIENINIDEEEMYLIEKRMNSINELKLKHGNSIEAIINKRDQLKNQLKTIESKDSIINELKENLNNEKNIYKEYANTLSDSRKKLAVDFIIKVSSQLEMLNMGSCTFNINHEIKNSEDLFVSQKGFDKMEFMISTNPGIPVKPLAKVASGGEISRVMLAIKISISKVDSIESLVFDEVDTGISGQTAVVVGKKLMEISNNYQVICITHLPQIAVMGDAHFLISKDLSDDFASTQVSELENENRYREVSRMLSGEYDSISMNNAKVMLKKANGDKLV